MFTLLVNTSNMLEQQAPLLRFAVRPTRGPTWLGPVAWCAIAMLAFVGRAPVGIIEVLLLAGPLLAVPLGLALLWATDDEPDGHRPLDAAIVPAGLAVAVSNLFGPGPIAIALTIPWLAVTVALATTAVDRQRHGPRPDLVSALRLIAVGWLPFAAGAITMTQAGVTAFGITPELVRLTGVHLNFAGFGAAVIASQVLDSSRRRDQHRRAAALAASLTVGGAMIVAVGHLSVRVIELAGATSMTVGVILLGVLSWTAAPRRSVARILLRVSGLSVLGSMGFALAYSWSLTVGASHLPYATIASVHGTLNAFGFTVCGLLGWLAMARHHPAIAPRSRLSSTSRRHDSPGTTEHQSPSPQRYVVLHGSS